MSRRLTRTVPILLVVGFLAACSGSVEFSFGGQTVGEAAIELIEGEAMAQRLGIEPLSAGVCDEPADDNVGTTFLCTADSAGETVEFDVTIEEDDRIFAAPTNVVAADFLDDYAISAVQSLNQANNLALAEDAMHCGERSIVLDADRQMFCALTDATGTVYNAALTIRDTELGIFDVEIVDVAE